MIGLIGISYKTAAIDIRERFSFKKEEFRTFSQRISEGDKNIELIILSTCNRTEIYFHYQDNNIDKAFKQITKALAEFKNFKSEDKEYFYFKNGTSAVNHLFKVASGLDALILGEDQIIGQVKTALFDANELHICGNILNRLFTKAFEAGKKVRSKTKINQGPGSVSSAAVELCRKHYPAISKHSLLMIGAGETGQLVLTSLDKHGIKNLYIANRSLDRATTLAEKYKGVAIGLDQIEKQLDGVDIVIVATDAKSYLLNANMLKNNTKSQLFIDLSVPRNINPNIGNLINKNLFAIDDLSQMVQSTNKSRKKEVVEAESIINVMSDEFMEWLLIRGLSPIFAKIKDNFRQVHQTELQGFVKVNGLGDNKVIDDYGKHISDKYARLFIKNLRGLAKETEERAYIEKINQLFNI